MFILYIIMFKIITSCTASNCFFYPLSLTIFAHALLANPNCLSRVSALTVSGTPWHTCTSRIKHTHFPDLPTPNVAIE